MILIHGQLVHWSHANTSDLPRNAFSLHVIDGALHYPANNWYVVMYLTPFSLNNVSLDFTSIMDRCLAYRLQRFDGKEHMRFSTSEH